MLISQRINGPGKNGSSDANSAITINTPAITINPDSAMPIVHPQIIAIQAYTQIMMNRCQADH